MSDIRKILPGIKKDMEKELETGEDVSRLSSYHVKIDVFEGPFDLLLHMIDDGRVDLYNVSLTKITQGYLEYIKTLEQYSIIIASEFLLMAAFLLEMKSKMLLPTREQPPEQDVEIENIEEILAERLVEYKIYKGLAQDLRDRKEIFQKVYTRYTPKEAFDNQEFFLVDISLRDLALAFKKVWDSADSRDKTSEIIAESISVDDKIEEVLDIVSKKNDGVEFEGFFVGASKLSIIVTFLAMLELIKRRLIRIRQVDLFGKILIYGVED